MRVIIVLLVLIAICVYLARFVFAKRGIRVLQNLFSTLALVLAVVCAYILFLAIMQGHSLF